MAYFPLTLKSYVLYPAALGSGIASFGNPFSTYFIGHGPAAAFLYNIETAAYLITECLYVSTKELPHSHIFQFSLQDILACSRTVTCYPPFLF